MKTTVLVTCSLLTCASLFAQNEEAAIRKVLHDETTAFFKHDFSKTYSYWHITPQSLAVVSEINGNVLYLTDRELNAAYVNKVLRDTLLPDHFERTKWLLRVQGNTAYVTFQQATFKAQTAVQTYESRYMEKINGQWKIISMTVVGFKE